jgi:hypothetical protein
MSLPPKADVAISKELLPINGVADRAHRREDDVDLAEQKKLLRNRGLDRMNLQRDGRSNSRKYLGQDGE